MNKSSDIINPAGQISLFSSQAANANGSALSWIGGDGSFVVYGTFDSGTVKLQFTPDAGTTWIDAPGVSLSANGAVNFRLGPCAIRSVLSGSSGSSNLNCVVL